MLGMTEKPCKSCSALYDIDECRKVERQGFSERGIMFYDS